MKWPGGESRGRDAGAQGHYNQQDCMDWKRKYENRALNQERGFQVGRIVQPLQRLWASHIAPVSGHLWKFSSWYPTGLHQACTCGGGKAAPLRDSQSRALGPDAHHLLTGNSFPTPA